MQKVAQRAPGLDPERGVRAPQRALRTRVPPLGEREVGRGREGADDRDVRAGAESRLVAPTLAICKTRTQSKADRGNTTYGSKTVTVVRIF